LKLLKTSAASSSRRWSGTIASRLCLLLGALAASLCIADEAPVLAATSSSKTYGLFSGRAKVTLPKGAAAPKKLGASTFIVRPKEASKKFVVYVTREPLRPAEIKMSKREFGESIKKLLEAQGHTILSYSARGQDYRVDFTTYAVLPWQAVGTTPARGVAKFTRTADKQLIGSVLMCDPTQWLDSGIAGFKQAVSRTNVSQR
jgi:hypothetical protein